MGKNCEQTETVSVISDWDAKTGNITLFWSMLFVVSGGVEVKIKILIKPNISFWGHLPILARAEFTVCFEALNNDQMDII